MKLFIVELKIIAGEYEKSSKKLVEANTSADACDAALLGECHGSIGQGAEYDEDRSGISDMYWTFHYSVSSCIEVAEKHADVIRLYFN